MPGVLRRCVLLAGALLCIVPAPTRANPRADFQSWSAVLATARLSEDAADLRLWLDTHLRRGEDVTTVIARPALGYVITDWASVWAGYAWVPVTRDDVGADATAHEHRAWQQLVLSGAAAGQSIALQARTRFEQRFLDGDSGAALRIRQFARVGYRPGATGLLGLSIWDEVFWGFSDTDLLSSGYDQNRLFVGPAVFAGDRLRLEAGYLFVHLRRRPDDQAQHVVALNIFATLPP